MSRATIATGRSERTGTTGLVRQNGAIGRPQKAAELGMTRGFCLIGKLPADRLTHRSLYSLTVPKNRTKIADTG